MINDSAKNIHILSSISDGYGHSTRARGRYDEPTATSHDAAATAAATTTHDAVAAPHAAADGHGQPAGIPGTNPYDAKQTSASRVRAPDGRPTSGRYSASNI